MGRRSKAARAKRKWSRSRRIPAAPEGYRPFVDRFRELGERETRVLTFLQDTDGIPAGEYTFAEAFCVKPGCDCRRAKFLVMYRRRSSGAPVHVLTIGFGWESKAFYTEWIGDAEISEQLTGAMIEPGSPLPPWGSTLLREFEKTSLSSPLYVERVARHYRMFKGG